MAKKIDVQLRGTPLGPLCGAKVERIGIASPYGTPTSTRSPTYYNTTTTLDPLIQLPSTSLKLSPRSTDQFRAGVNAPLCVPDHLVNDLFGGFDVLVVIS